MRNRINYKISRILINGIEPTNTKVTSFTTNFVLKQCFCSCPQPITSVHEISGPCDRCWTKTECHYDFCSGGEDKRRLGVYDMKNKQVILDPLEDRLKCAN